MRAEQPNRKSYGQYCGLARALDVVGDRWTLLIVRELLIGPRRFGELQAGLLGIATNLLTSRLRQMEDQGLIIRSLGEPGTGIRYALSSRGQDLRQAIEALLRWSIPLMVSGRNGQEVRASWLAVALPALLLARPRRRVVIQITACGEDLWVIAGRNGIRVALDKTDAIAAVDAEIVAEPEVILGLASGALDLRTARQHGAAIKGNASAIALVFGGRASCVTAEDVTQR